MAFTSGTYQTSDISLANHTHEFTSAGGEINLITGNLEISGNLQVSGTGYIETAGLYNPYVTGANGVWKRVEVTAGGTIGAPQTAYIDVSTNGNTLQTVTVPGIVSGSVVMPVFGGDVDLDWAGDPLPATFEVGVGLATPDLGLQLPWSDKTNPSTDAGGLYMRLNNEPTNFGIKDDTIWCTNNNLNTVGRYSFLVWP